MDNLSGSSIFVVAGIWSIVFIGYYVWYLWSLSRLFPKIGLPSWAGWVPVWNTWQLVQRGGLPGWLVLLGLIPILGVVVLVVLIIAINRINSEHGKGPGFTVLGVVLAPLWAMLLANHIRDSSYAGPSSGSARPLTPSGIPGFGPQPTHADPNGTDWQGLPPVPPQAYQQQAPQQQPGQHQYGQQPFNQPQPYQQPQQPQQPQHAPPMPPQQAPQTRSPQEQLWAEPSHQQIPSAPEAPHVAQAPQAPQAPNPYAHTPPAPPVAPPPAAQVPPAPPAPVPPAPVPPAPGDNWGFSSTTEGAFERLAAEEAQRSGNTPLGVAQSQRQFSWPSPEPDENAEIAARSPLVLPEPPAAVPHVSQPQAAEPQAAAPQAAEPQAAAPQAAEPQAVAPAPAPAPAPAEPAAPAPEPAPIAPPQLSPEELTSAADDDAPLIFDTGSSRRAEAAASGDVSERTGTASAVPTSTGTASTANTASAPNAAAAATATAATATAAANAAATSAAAAGQGVPAGSAADAASHDDELDRTVVVVRRPRWGLELPDGDVLELLTDDVVLGRKPEALDGASVLQIVDPTRTMSKTHARLRRDGETWTIEDLQSTNGVAVIDQHGQATQIDANLAVPATPRLVIGTLEVKLQPIV